MKKTIFSAVIALALVCFSYASFAQNEQKPRSSKWISDKGYWVVEGNVHTPKNNTIYFYNPDNVLVYKEVLNGIKIKTNKKKVLLRLKNILEQSVTTWEQQHTATENQMLVSIALRK